MPLIASFEATLCLVKKSFGFCKKAAGSRSWPMSKKSKASNICDGLDYRYGTKVSGGVTNWIILKLASEKKTCNFRGWKC